MSQTLHQPHPNLWVAQSDVFTTNSGIFFAGEAACLIDPAVLPADMHAIQRLLDSQHLKPEYLVITHYHYDHVFGPEHFPDVRVIAQTACQNALYGDEYNRLQENVRRFESEYQVKRSKAFRLPLPDITFESGMSLQIGDLALELRHSPGHSPDQCVIFQPEFGILWAADMLSDLEIPFVYENLLDYQRTLQELNRLEVSLLIPGHGYLTHDAKEIRQRFAEDIDYLAELRQQVEQAIQSGQSLQETQAACAGMRFRHPQDNASPHRLNVEIAYQRFKDAG